MLKEKSLRIHLVQKPNSKEAMISLGFQGLTRGAKKALNRRKIPSSTAFTQMGQAQTQNSSTCWRGMLSIGTLR